MDISLHCHALDPCTASPPQQGRDEVLPKLSTTDEGSGGMKWRYGFFFNVSPQSKNDTRVVSDYEAVELQLRILDEA